MAWQFLFAQRRGFRSSDQWGTLFVRSAAAGWEQLSRTYELPWREDAQGRSKNNVSRIKEGEYELQVRTNGAKGWRLELLRTGHRKNVQIHRAHKSMYIEGCLLPVDFLDFRNEPASGVGPIELLKKGDRKIQHRSVAIMEQIRLRYEQMRPGKDGNPTIIIAATLPAFEPLARRTAIA
jgi:Family of unknown function (DUF5675)